MRWHILFGFLLVASLLAIQPTTATATCSGLNGTENFESYTAFFRATYPGTSNCLYSESSTTPGIVVPAGQSTAPTTENGDQIWYNNHSPSAAFLFTNPCATGISSSGVTYTFDFQIPAFSGGTNVYGSNFLAVGFFPNTDSLGGIGITNAGIPGAYTRGGGGAATFSTFSGATAISINTWYTASFTIAETTNTNNFCEVGTTITGSITGASYTTRGGTYTSAFSHSLVPTSAYLGFDIDTFNDALGLGGGTVDGYLDNIGTDGYATTGAGEGALFCPDAFITESSGTGDSPNYGYTYRRGGGFFDQSDTDLTGVGLSTGFLYEGTTGTESTWDYSAKGLTSGTHAAHQNITMEAATDTVSSNFRVSFMTNTGATPDATSKGNGVNTGNFANHAEAQFIEAGNTWQVGIYYVTAGGSKTQIGSSVNYGHSNDATDFTVYLDTRAPNPYISVVGSTGQILTSNGTANNAEAFRTAFSGDPIYDFWLIGAGSSGLATPATAIDENQQHDLDNTDDEGGHDSTCIFDDEGVGVVLGTSGVAPGSSIEQPPSDPEEPDDPAHLDFGSTAANLVAGALFIIGMAFLAIEKGAGNVGIGVVVVGALFLSHVVGWIPLGYMIMLMVLAVAALWFLPSFGGGKAQDGGL